LEAATPAASTAAGTLALAEATALVEAAMAADIPGAEVMEAAMAAEAMVAGTAAVATDTIAEPAREYAAGKLEKPRIQKTLGTEGTL
jgi:hypothetical protein